MIEHETIVAAARGWLGTPYHHQASVKGVGCDCLGLIRGVWREIYGSEPEAMPAYTRDWGNATGSETLIAAACRHLVRLDDVNEAAPGDVLVFRMRDRGVAKHAGVISALPRFAHLERDGPNEPASMIHSQEGLGVVEIPLGRWWLRRAVAAFRFPDKETFVPLLKGRVASKASRVG
jgi:NlpC/P60 family putative phage cell wall peptidase